MIKKNSAGRWGFVVDVAPPGTSKRRQLRRRGFETKGEAQAELNDILTEVQAGAYVRPTKVTTSDFLAEWIDSIRATIEATTWDSYQRMVDNHLRPRLGDVPLAALDPPTINRMYADLLTSGRRDGRGGLSPRTVLYAHTVLHRALHDAVKWGKVARNVAALADPPSAKSARPPEMKFWTPEELRAFLDFVADERHYPAFRLAAMTGMRRGEVFGLQWGDVDLDDGRVTVRRQLRTVRHVPELVEVTKSSAGRRTIDLDDETVAVLRSHRAAQGREKLALGGGYDDADRVFAGVDGSQVNPASAAKVFERRVARSGLPRIRFHDLRHTHAVHLIAAGVHAKVVSERLGHSSTTFTMDRYGHLMPNIQAGAASTVAAMVDR